MSRDFYVVLGISPDADLDQIKIVYRRLIKLYHPDVGPHPIEKEKILQVRETYEALAEQPAKGERAAAEQGRFEPRVPVGPLVVDRSGRPAAKARKRRPLAEQLAGRFTELDEFFAGWVPGLFHAGRHTPQRKDLFVELVLAPSEARTGGMIPLQIPIEQGCADCDGIHVAGGLVCSTCQGGGRVVDYHQIEVSVPPGVADGTESRISLGDIGLPNTDLHVLVTVEV